MNIIILGDKYQKRMKSRGCIGLIKHNNKNILYHQYKILSNRFPYANLIYVYGFDHKRFSSFISKNSTLLDNMSFVRNAEYEKYNSVYSLNLVKDYLNDDCLILFGDNIIKRSTFTNFKNSIESQIFIDINNKTKLGCVINKDYIENISYDLDNYVSEIYFISKSQVGLFKQLISNSKYHNYFIFEILNKMIDLNYKIIPHSMS